MDTVKTLLMKSSCEKEDNVKSPWNIEVGSTNKAY